MSFVLLGILNSQAAGAFEGESSYDLLETTVLGSNQSSVSFTGLDSYTDYKHLQIRISAFSNRSSSADNILGQFNGDTGSNYVFHSFTIVNNSLSSQAQLNRNSMFFGSVNAQTSPSQAFTPAVIDILDFSSSSKNTTIKFVSGNTDRELLYWGSNAYFQTPSITSILFFNQNDDFVANSRFSLYGLKAGS